MIHSHRNLLSDHAQPTDTPLTSLRLFFAMMVFGAHCYVIDSFFDAHCFKEGFVGVSFFFLLNGFIIAYNYQHRLQEKQIGRRTFWVARIARIYPLHWLTLFIAAALGHYVTATDGADYLAHFLASLTLTNAYIPEADYFFSFNSPSWSLCCEQLFYFCFPFLVPLAKNYKHLLYLFAFAAAVVTGMYFTPEAAIKGYWYVNPLTRLPDFIAGMLLFRLYEYFQTKDITLLQGSILEVLSVVFFLFLGTSQLFPAKRHLVAPLVQPPPGKGWRNQLQFLPDTPFRAVVVCRMAENSRHEDSLVRIDTHSVCLHHPAEPALLPVL